MKPLLLPLLFLLSTIGVSAQNLSVEVKWTKSVTAGATNVLYLARAPTAATNIAGGLAYRFPVGTNVLVRALLSPGVWNIAARSQHATLESIPTLLTFTVPGPVSGLGAAVVSP